MMQLKHLNLTTSDVTGLTAFFERFFGFRRLLERRTGAFTLMSNADRNGIHDRAFTKAGRGSNRVTTR